MGGVRHVQSRHRRPGRLPYQGCGLRGRRTGGGRSGQCKARHHGERDLDGVRAEDHRTHHRGGHTREHPGDPRKLGVQAHSALRGTAGDGDARRRACRSPGACGSDIHGRRLRAGGPGEQVHRDQAGHGPSAPRSAQQGRPHADLRLIGRCWQLQGADVGLFPFGQLHPRAAAGNAGAGSRRHRTVRRGVDRRGSPFLL